jgi:hypothetical protein
MRKLVLKLMHHAKLTHNSCLDFVSSTATKWRNVNPPVVTVPVLSNRTAFTLPNASNFAPPFIMIPRLAAAASPAEYVTGVLIVRAQGQLMTMKISPVIIHSRPVSTPKNQGRVQMRNEIARTTGVYFLAKASTSF